MRRKIREFEASGAIWEIQDGNHGERHPKAKDFTAEGVPFVMARDFSNGRLDLDGACKIPKQLADSLRIGFARPGDVLLTHKGTVGQVAIVPMTSDYVMLTPQVTYYRTNPLVLLNKFLMYSFQTPHFRQQLESYSAQSTRPYIGITAQRELELEIPPLPIQRRITEILSAYDDLIENSQRRIQILESMARGLYREWFVHFRFPGHEGHPRVASPLGEIPQEWEWARLGQVSTNLDRFRRPLSKQQRSEMQGEYPYYGAAKIFDHVNAYVFDGEYLLVAEDGSVITENLAPVLQLVNGKFWPNNHTHVLQGLSPFSTYYLYLCLSLLNVSPYITGAAQPKITQENLGRIPVVCGPAALHLRFNDLVEPVFRQIQGLQSQIQNLRKTRDLLLPRLLSGQINLEEAGP